MKNIDYIVTAEHYCKKIGVSNVRQRIMKIREGIQRKKQMVIEIQIDKVSTSPVYARIELGQWVADCACGGCEFVDPNDPIFFCFSCANREDAHMLRPVVFPELAERQKIEELILARPINDRRGLDDLERAHMAMPMIVKETWEGAIIPLTRTWNPGEPIENLEKENEVIEKYKEALGSGNVVIIKEEPPVIEEEPIEPEDPAVETKTRRRKAG